MIKNVLGHTLTYAQASCRLYMSSLATLVNLELKVKCAWPEQNAYLQADHAMHHSQTSENRFLSLIQLAESEIYCLRLNSFTLRMARAP